MTIFSRSTKLTLWTAYQSDLTVQVITYQKNTQQSFRLIQETMERGVIRMSDERQKKKEVDEFSEEIVRVSEKENGTYDDVE